MKEEFDIKLDVTHIKSRLPTHEEIEKMIEEEFINRILL